MGQEENCQDDDERMSLYQEAAQIMFGTTSRVMVRMVGAISIMVLFPVYIKR